MPEYVYGVVERGAPAPSGEGIAGAPLRLIGSDAAAALVSELPTREIELDRTAMLTHAQVLSDAIAHGTVLPMRFGVVMGDPAEVRDRVLLEHAAELAAQLEELRGKVEISVRVTYEEKALMREILAERPDIRALGERLRDRPPDATYYERINLGELIAGAMSAKREIDAANIATVLSQIAVATEASPPVHERVVIDAACLVRREGVSEFDQVLEAYAAGQWGRMRFRSTAPRAPHSFVALTAEA
jgi:hypothetical protein